MVNSQGRRTYVLDTSVLLADPAAIARFDEHKVVLPVVVITELEAKRHHPELGYFARQALRHLDDLRIEHGRLDAELKQDIHEGIWGLFIKFGLGASNVGPTDSDLNPAAIIAILEIGLQKFEKETNISVDASKVNPRAAEIARESMARVVASTAESPVHTFSNLFRRC